MYQKESNEYVAEKIYFGDACAKKLGGEIDEVHHDLFVKTITKSKDTGDRVEQYMCLNGGQPTGVIRTYKVAEVTAEINLVQIAEQENADLLLALYLQEGKIQVPKISVVYKAIMASIHSDYMKKEFSNSWASAAAMYLCEAYKISVSKKKKFIAMLSQLLYHDLLAMKNSNFRIFVSKDGEFLDNKIRQAAIYAGVSLEPLKKLASFDFVITQSKITCQGKRQSIPTVLEERDYQHQDIPKQYTLQ